MAGGGGSDPNLTPFIDLFSVLVCFLLMTAAWLQLESVPVVVEKSPTASANNNEITPPPTNKDEEKKVKLSLFVYLDKLILKENEKEIELPHQIKKFDTIKLKAILADWKIRYPKKTDIILNTDAKVSYGELINIYDFLVGNKFPDIGINPY